MKAIAYLPRRLVYNFGYLNFDLARVADLPFLLIICRHIYQYSRFWCDLRDGND